jgi:hypothetical protein
MKAFRAGMAVACLLACSGCALPGYEFPGVRGQILDRATNMPIAHAQVSIAPFLARGRFSQATSDPAGRFGIPPGGELFALHPISMEEAWTDGWLEVSANGYRPQQVAVLDLTKGVPSEIVIYLDRP